MTNGNFKAAIAMTQTTRQQVAFYQRPGLSFLGVSFEKAMQTPALRIAISCGARASSKGQPAPIQPDTHSARMEKTMIDRNTIWTETYNRQALALNNAAHIELFSAIHHYTGSYKTISRLDLCSNLRIAVSNGPAACKLELDLTPEQMETLAGYLNDTAERVRALQQRLADEEAEIALAARADLEAKREAA